MEFEGQYLTYEEYKSLDGNLNKTPFDLLEFEARKKIDKRTQMRLINCDNIPNEVKICEFNLINTISKYVETIMKSSGIIASENTDGYVVSYINATQIREVIKSKDSELNDIIENNLYGVIVNNEHILYLGVN